MIAANSRLKGYDLRTGRERILATPAISGRTIYVRTAQRLWAFTRYKPQRGQAASC